MFLGIGGAVGLWIVIGIYTLHEKLDIGCKLMKARQKLLFLEDAIVKRDEELWEAYQDAKYEAEKHRFRRTALQVIASTIGVCSIASIVGYFVTGY